MYTVTPLILKLGVGWTVIFQLHAPAALKLGEGLKLITG